MHLAPFSPHVVAQDETGVYHVVTVSLTCVQHEVCTPGPVLPHVVAQNETGTYHVVVKK